MAEARGIEYSPDAQPGRGGISGGFEEKEGLLHLADEAMYLVKNTDRDRVAAANVGILPMIVRRRGNRRVELVEESVSTCILDFWLRGSVWVKREQTRKFVCLTESHAKRKWGKRSKYPEHRQECLCHSCTQLPKSD